MKETVALMGIGMALLAPAPTKAQEARKPLDPVIERMANFVGGTWRGEVKGPQGTMVVEFVYRWHPDKRGLVGEGIIGKGRKDAVHVQSMYGYDPQAKKPYYFDTHNSDTLYFGHIRMEGDLFVFEFGPLGGKPDAFSSRGRFTDRDTYQTIIKQADGSEIVGFALKRRR